MEHFAGMALPWLWAVSVQLAIVSILVWGISRCCRNAPAATRYLLWIVVLAKIFIPPIGHIPSHLAIGYSSGISVPIYGAQVLPSIPSAHGERSLSTHAPQTRVIPQPVFLRSMADRYSAYLSLVWISGVLILGFLLAVRWYWQSRLLRGLTTVDEDVKELLQYCASRMGISRIPKIGYSTYISTPMLTGIRHPVIVLPQGICEICDSKELSAMLLHELAHAKRRDLLGVWLYQFAKALLFFHPAVWIAGRELDREREFACDELVLSSSAITRKEYATGYLSAIKLASGTHQAQAALTMAEPFDIEFRRLKSILETAIPRPSRRWIVIVSIAAIIVLPTFSIVGYSSDGIRAPRAATVSAVAPMSSYASISKADAERLARDYANSHGFRAPRLISASRRNVKTIASRSGDGSPLKSVSRLAWVLQFQATHSKARDSHSKITLCVDAAQGSIIYAHIGMSYH